VEDTKTGSRDTFAVLADLARAMQDAGRRQKLRDDPAREVEGFDQLPSELRETFAEMSPQEMAAVGRVHAALVETGYFVRNGDGREDLPLRLSMF